MPQTMQGLMQQYVSNVRAIYGSHLRQIILYGSYARGDYNMDHGMAIKTLPADEEERKELIKCYNQEQKRQHFRWQIKMELYTL